MNMTTREYRIIAFFVALILFIVLFFTQCNSNTTKANITTKEVVVTGFDGRFDPIQPIPLPEKKQFEKTVEYKGKRIKLTKQFDEKKADKFVEALKDTSDVTKPVRLYVEAVEKNHYQQFFKNADMEITIEASTTGGVVISATGGNLTINNININPYKVYTALLIQSGGDDPQSLSSGALTKGVTYKIDGGNDGDFSNVGSPSNDDSTSFVAINDEVPNNYGTCVLLYNTGAPVVTVLENTIGYVWFTYNNIGSYAVISDGLFIADKTTCITSQSAYNDTGVTFIYRDTESLIYIETQDFFTPGAANDILARTMLEIRVYN